MKFATIIALAGYVSAETADAQATTEATSTTKVTDKQSALDVLTRTGVETATVHFENQWTGNYYT